MWRARAIAAISDSTNATGRGMTNVREARKLLDKYRANDAEYELASSTPLDR